MSEWLSYTIGEIAAHAKSALATGPFGSAVSSKNFRSSGVPMLRGSNLTEEVGTRLNETDLVYLDPVLAETFSRSTARRGDLIFTCWGSVGQIGLVDASSQYESYIVSNKQMKLTPNSEIVDSTFLYYYLSQPSMVFEVQSRAIGSTIPGFNLGQLRSLQVSLPAIDEQRAIAEVLGALDDKIAANTKLAETSARLASSVFSETLEIERSSKQLKLVAQNVPGKYLPKDEYVEDGDYFVYGSNSVMGKYDRYLCAGNFTVLAKIGSYCGNLRWSQRPAWVNNNASAIVPLEGVNPWILRHALENLDMGPHRAGTGQPYVRMESLFSAEVDLPSPACSERISPSLESLAETEAVAIEENRTLAATRDTLLPQLMSGKLRVKDIEHTMGEMV